MNMAFILVDKAFKLNYLTPTNNKQRISLNPCNRQIAQLGMNLGQDRQMQMVEGNAAQAEGNAIRINGNQIRCYNCKGLGHFPRICIVRPRRRDAAYLQTQLLMLKRKKQESNSKLKSLIYGSAEVHNYDNCYDNEIFNMFTQKEQYTKLLEPIPKPQQVKQNDSNVISEVSSVEQDGGTVDQHPVSEQKDTTKGTSVNTQFCKQSILGKPPSSSKPKVYAVTPYLKSKGLPKIDETHALSKPVTSNSLPTLQKSNVMKNDNKDVNSDSNGLFSIGEDNTAKTRRRQPRRNTKNDRVPFMSKSSYNKNKEVEVEKHLRNLLLSKNKEHMSSECNHVKLAIRNDKSEVVCAMCKQCLITANHDVCVLNYVNDMNSRGKKQKANVSNTKNKKKQKLMVMKPKKVGSNEYLLHLSLINLDLALGGHQLEDFMTLKEK
uniref:CCHC-type domain-containing protein n=1 Tax=Tanacetum cinerariifolium TaxID=118510 RepID=A0A699GJL7_TANCI|nr:hypothetical protein [Tanacetum cinerariifolium]